MKRYSKKKMGGSRRINYSARAQANRMRSLTQQSKIEAESTQEILKLLKTLAFENNTEILKRIVVLLEYQNDLIMKTIPVHLRPNQSI